MTLDSIEPILNIKNYSDLARSPVPQSWSVNLTQTTWLFLSLSLAMLGEILNIKKDFDVLFYNTNQNFCQICKLQLL